MYAQLHLPAPSSGLVAELSLCLQVKSSAVIQDIALQAGFHSRAVKVFMLLLSLALQQLFSSLYLWFRINKAI